jgi:NAD(P)-dependent dehydrogenase (short-subunit alcohol dehydrogenase family)
VRWIPSARIDVVVNNAGIHATKPSTRWRTLGWDLVFGSTLKSAYKVLHWPHGANFRLRPRITSGIYGSFGQSTGQARSFGLTRTLAIGRKEQHSGQCHYLRWQHARMTEGLIRRRC